MPKKLKPWSELAEEDIYEIRRGRCTRCPYAYAGHNNHGEITPFGNFCNYIVITGHRRGVRPELCTHYLDKDVKIPKRNGMGEVLDSLDDPVGLQGDCF